MQKRIKEILGESARLVTAMADNPEIGKLITGVVEDIVTSIKTGGKVIVFGDGGSAADSQHLVGELIGRFKKDRSPIPAIALTTNTSTLTAVGNDYGFDETFSRQVRAMARKGDIVLGISTSGNSQNVLKAVEEANKLKAVTVGLAGKDGGKLKTLCKYSLCIPSSDTPRVQEAHITIIHIIAELVEEKLCK